MAHALAVALSRRPQQQVHQPALLGVGQERPRGQAIAQGAKKMLPQEVGGGSGVFVRARSNLSAFCRRPGGGGVPWAG